MRGAKLLRVHLTCIIRPLVFALLETVFSELVIGDSRGRTKECETRTISYGDGRRSDAADAGEALKQVVVLGPQEERLRPEKKREQCANIEAGEEL